MHYKPNSFILGRSKKTIYPIIHSHKKKLRTTLKSLQNYKKTKTKKKPKNHLNKKEILS